MNTELLRPLKSRAILMVALLISMAYILLQILVLNGRLLAQTLQGSFDFSYKITVLGQLIQGYFMMFPLSQTILGLVTALLIGLNLTLIISLMQKVKESGPKQLSFGGIGIVALASTGCPSCGLTILSLFGPSFAVVGVLFNSIFVQMTIIGVLVISIAYSLIKLNKSLVCQVAKGPITHVKK